MERERWQSHGAPGAGPAQCTGASDARYASGLAPCWRALRSPWGGGATRAAPEVCSAARTPKHG